MSLQKKTGSKSSMTDGGLRHDEGKPRMDLLPPDALFAIAEVLTHGAEKYSDRNWEKGMRWGKAFAPIFRHLFKFWLGRDRDKESGLLHLAHAAYSVIFLLTYQLRGIGTDDRNKQKDGLD